MMMGTTHRLPLFLALGALMASAHAARAGDPAAPDDAAFIGAKVVGVLPVMATESSRERHYRRLGGALASAFARTARTARAGQAADARDLPTLVAPPPLAFAGPSLEADLFLLHYAFALGALPTLADEPRRALVTQLATQRGALANLTPVCGAAIDRALASAAGGNLDANALATAMRAAEAGTASGDPRAHGYFVAGLWFAFSLTMASAEQPDLSFVAMAGPLARMFDEDAEFGGSDRQIAKTLREAARLGAAPFVGQARVDVDALKAVIRAVLAIKGDGERG